MNSDERIQRIFARGKTRFVLMSGVLRFGLITAALVAVFTLITKKELHATDIVMPFIILPIMGIFWGLWMWHFVVQKKAAKIEDTTQV
jgi:hypothetical protein